jgi:hypothetical protein
VSHSDGTRQDGLYFLQIMKWAVLQYCVIRPVYVNLSTGHSQVAQVVVRTTLAAVILDYAGLYCEASLSPRWGHLYVSCPKPKRRKCTHQLSLPDCRDRLGIRFHRHVLLDPALCRGFRTAQVTPAFAKTLLFEGSWLVLVWDLSQIVHKSLQFF